MDGVRKSCIYTQQNTIQLLKKKENLQYVTTWVNLEDTAQWNDSHRNEENPWFHFHEVSKVAEFTESKHETLISRGKGKLVINSHRFNSAS